MPHQLQSVFTALPLPADEGSISDTVLHNGFLSLNRNWNIQYLNTAAEYFLGQHAKDLIGKNFLKAVSVKLPLDLYHKYNEVMIRNEPGDFQHHLGNIGSWSDVVVIYSQELLSVSFKHQVSRDYDGKSSVFTPQAHQFKVLTELYRAVTAVTNDCLWEWDLQNDEILWIDGGHKRHFGYDIGNIVISSTFRDQRIHPEDGARVKAGLTEALEDDTFLIWKENYRFQKSDGAFLYVQDRAQIIRDDHGVAIRMIGATCNINDKRILEINLEQQQRFAQRTLTEAVITAQERERSEIGEELHDNLNQILAVCKMYIQLAMSAPANSTEHLNKSLGFIVDVMTEIRRISKVLVIPGVHIIGMSDNIKNLIWDLAQIHSLQISYSPEGITDDEIPEKLQVSIFRIIQEQINNILKHADASKVDVTLLREGNDLLLTIDDDGKGCDLTRNQNGVGLINIKSRAELFDGKAVFKSTCGEGFKLQVSLKLDAADLTQACSPV